MQDSVLRLQFLDISANHCLAFVCWHQWCRTIMHSQQKWSNRPWMLWWVMISKAQSPSMTKKKLLPFADAFLYMHAISGFFPAYACMLPVFPSSVMMCDNSFCACHAIFSSLLYMHACFLSAFFCHDDWQSCPYTISCNLSCCFRIKNSLCNSVPDLVFLHVHAYVLHYFRIRMRVPFPVLSPGFCLYTSCTLIVSSTEDLQTSFASYRLPTSSLAAVSTSVLLLLSFPPCTCYLCVHWFKSFYISLSLKRFAGRGDHVPSFPPYLFFLHLRFMCIQTPFYSEPVLIILASHGEHLRT